MMTNEANPTLSLFPEQTSVEEENDNTFGLEIQEGTGNTSMNATGEGDLDLDLNVG